MVNIRQYLRLITWIATFTILFILYRRLFWFFIREGKWALAVNIIAIILAVGSMLGASAFYVYHGFGHQPDIFRHGNRLSNQVALTFDDGPSAEYTPDILAILKEYNVPATFFLVGSHVDKYPEIAQQIAEADHEIGNHTYNHVNIPTLGSFQLQREVTEATAIITAITGKYPEYIRPPRGMYDSRFRRLANLLGQQVVLWTVSSRDWRYGVTKDQIVHNVLSRVKSGDIILFHDSGALIRNEGGDRSATVKALPAVIQGLRAKGLEIVPLRDLIAEEEPTEEYPKVDMPE